MKNLKKFVFVVLLVFVTAFTIDVYASLPPYYWTIDGQTISDDNPTATLVRDGKTNTLKLNNYNGKGIKLECLGTGQDGMEFIIELIGDNVITDTNIGIDFAAGGNNGPIKFKGAGTLKINAPKPISYENYQNTMIIKPSSNVYTDKEVVNEPTKSNKETSNSTVESDEVKDDDQANLIAPNEKKSANKNSNDSNNNNNMIIYILFGVYMVLSLTIITIFGIALAKRKKEA